jgi:hypothetical protein
VVEGGGVRGRASAVQHRTEISGGGMNNSSATTTHVLLFRIERPGQPPLQVQMKGRFMSGTRWPLYVKVIASRSSRPSSVSSRSSRTSSRRVRRSG